MFAKATPQPTAHPSACGLGRTEFGLLLALIALALVASLGLPLFDPDEGRNANVAREMLAARDWLVPRLHGLPYLDKPALLFAAVAACFSLLGISEVVARLPALLAGVATLFFTWRLARLWWPSGVARSAVLIVASAPLFLGFARCVIFDLPLTACVLAAWVATEEARRGARGAVVRSAFFTAAAVLIKGPIGLLLPILGSIALALGQGDLRLARLFTLRYWAILALVLVPWLWLVEHREPGFLRYALFTETFERMTQPTLKRTGPPWYYLPVLLAGLFPWGAVIGARLAELVRAARNSSPTRGLLWASGAILVFFSLSSSKLPGYVLPMVPLLALLAASPSREPRQHSHRRDALVIAVQLLVVAIVAVVALIAPLPVGRWLRVTDRVAVGLPGFFRGMALGFGACGVVVLVAAIRRLPRASWIGVGAALPVFLLLALPALQVYAEEYGSERIAREVRSSGVPLERVACDRCYPTGLEFYLDRSVLLASDDARELTSNYIRRAHDGLVASGRMNGAALIDQAQFRRRLLAGEFDLVLSRRAEAPDSTFTLLTQVHRTRLWLRRGR